MTSVPERHLSTVEITNEGNKNVYKFDTFLTGLCHFCLYEKSFFVKHQPKLYLVDV